VGSGSWQRASPDVQLRRTPLIRMFEVEAETPPHGVPNFCNERESVFFTFFSFSSTNSQALRLSRCSAVRIIQQQPYGEAKEHAR
ncbi:hypothetical protein MPH_05772, partial [Macrophomina phaseolina MS6]